MNIESAVVGMIGTNFYVVTDPATGESLAIDTGADYAELQHLLDGKKIRYILLTHGHYDHILGTPEARRQTGAQVVISRQDAPCLADEMRSRAGLHFPKAQEPMQPDVIVQDGDTLPFGNTQIRVLATPGHTPGSVCYLFPAERLLFSGDTLFYRNIGRTDFPNGSEADMARSLRRLRDLDGDYAVYPGHGMMTTLAEERRYNYFMR